MAPRLKAKEFTGTDVKSRFLEALNQVPSEDYQVLKKGVVEQFTPSGSIVWDEVLRLKGIPHRGRVITIHGKEHGGKSTLAYGLIASHQRHTGEPAVIFDFENTCSLEYLEGIGVDTSEDMITVRQPGSIDRCVKEALIFMKAGVRLFVFDSVPRMKNSFEEKEIMDGTAFKASIGRHAKDISSFFDAILPYAAKYDACLIMVNQIRARIDASQEAAMAQKYPSMTNLPYVLPGGNQIRYVPSITLEVNVAKAFRAGGADDEFLFEGTDDDKGDFIVNKVKVRVLKNKSTAGGYREGVLWIRPGRGVDDFISVRELARHYDLIKNSGKKWIVGDAENPIATYENKAQAIRELVEEPDATVLNKLREMVALAIRADKQGFTTSLTAQDRYVSGDTDEMPDFPKLEKFNLNDDDVSL
jgi:RecA/RadA recombinase